jgi:hypothetical protein
LATFNSFLNTYGLINEYSSQYTGCTNTVTPVGFISPETAVASSSETLPIKTFSLIGVLLFMVFYFMHSLNTLHEFSANKGQYIQLRKTLG